MSKIIETKALSKIYGKKRAVDSVSLTVERGEIYGLIGKNGAGKTTLMKLVLGLAFPKDGEIRLFESDDLSAGRKKIGSLIEAPGLYSDESAYGNLRRFGALTGADDEEIKRIIEIVGLESAGNKPAGAYSLGMKQRLGIGIALLGSPELLVLDEPVNGLDPSGIRDVRDLILELNAKGVTVLISSHLLDELGKIATKFGIMRDGHLVKEITRGEIDALSRDYLFARVDDSARAREILLGLYEGASILLENDAIVISAEGLDAAEINRVLVEGGIRVSELKYHTMNIEDYFIERMG